MNLPLASTPFQVLEFPPAQIHKVAREKLAGISIIGIFLAQLWAELRLRFYRHINFRKNQNAEARLAYCAMSTEEFEGINARQCWANWRTIPKSLSGFLPDQPLAVIDLC